MGASGAPNKEVFGGSAVPNRGFACAAFVDSLLLDWPNVKGAGDGVEAGAAVVDAVEVPKLKRLGAGACTSAGFAVTPKENAGGAAGAGAFTSAVGGVGIVFAGADVAGTGGKYDGTGVLGATSLV